MVINQFLDLNTKITLKNRKIDLLQEEINEMNKSYLLKLD